MSKPIYYRKKNQKTFGNTPEELKKEMEYFANQRRGIYSKKIGTINEKNSRTYVLQNYKKYGVPSEKYMLWNTGQQYMDDFFGLFDIITSPDQSSFIESEPNGINRNSFYTYYIQVKTKRLTNEDLLKIKLFKVPFWIKREVHVWIDGKLQIISI